MAVANPARPLAIPSPFSNLGSSDRAQLAAMALLVLTDAVAITAAIARFGRVTPNTAILVGLAVWSLAVSDHYRLKLHLSVLDDMMAIGGRVVVAVSLGAAYRELVSGHDVFTVDRLWVLVGSVIFVLVGRTIAYQIVRFLRLSGTLRRRTLFVGSADASEELREAIDANPNSGLVLLQERVELPLCPATLERLDADVAVVEINDGTNLDVTRLLRWLPRSGPEIFLLPKALMRYPGIIPGSDQLASIPLVPVRPAANRSVRWKLKRVIDLVLAVLLLPIATPILAVCAAILYLESGPGVLFRQERVGLGGRTFTLFKLRTIVAERQVSDRAWNVAPDEISPFARFCRATSIDELPQLWNVLRGDMSLVGPRPERPHFVDQFAESIPDYENRHRVPAGLTGLAQVHGMRGDTSISVRSRFDNSYIDNWSLFQDLKILCRTVTSMVSNRARRQPPRAETESGGDS